MTESRTIRRRTTQVSAASSGDAIGPGTLPTALSEMVPRRLAAAGLLYAIAYLLAWGVGQLLSGVSDAEPIEPWFSSDAWEIYLRIFPVSYLAAVSSILAGLTVFVAVRSARLSSVTIAWLGHVLLIAGAFGIAFAENWLPPLQFPRTGISWVCFWIGMYPMIVPGRPRAALLSSLAAASATPTVIGLAALLGLPPQRSDWVISWIAPNYISAIVATIAAAFIAALGRAVTRARELGSYRLVEKIGSGGMGEVWRAEHRMLARPAAIKLIRPDALGAAGSHGAETVLRRFEREAQATALLTSPHTVEVYDFGLTEQHAFFYVMELLVGFELETLVSRHGPMPAERAAHVLSQACHSLADAHENGMVHRDIKPANVFLCRRGTDLDFVKILDFGLVKPIESGMLKDANVTADGTAGGTPTYMAPEMALGDRAVDHRADIYALGCVGYWLLTGELVFASPTPMRAVLDHIKTEPTPPSQRTELPIPPDLETLILRCLAKDPVERPQSAIAVAEALAACGVEAPWTNERAQRWWRRHAPEVLAPRRAEIQAAAVRPEPSNDEG